MNIIQINMDNWTRRDFCHVNTNEPSDNGTVAKSDQSWSKQATGMHTFLVLVFFNKQVQELLVLICDTSEHLIASCLLQK